MKDRPTGKKRFGWRRVVVTGVVIALLYFGNVELQSYLGRKTLAGTGLEPVSLDQALEQARLADKLVLADMSAIWCPSCRRLDREVFSDPAVRQAIEAGYVFARIEYESEAGAAFMERYDVSGFPTLLVLEADGTLVRRLSISFEPARLLEQL